MDARTQNMSKKKLSSTIKGYLILCLMIFVSWLVFKLLTPDNFGTMDNMLSYFQASLIASAGAVVFSCMYTWYAIRTVYSDPRLRAQVEQLYNYYTGQLSGASESESAAKSEDPQQLISDILSGKYREEQGNASSSSVPENGGAFI